MSDPSYIHLRLHTEYSISDGILRIKDLCKAAAEDEMPAIAITDLSNLFGMVKFFKEARKYGIKPIIGCDVWVTNPKDRQSPFRGLLLVQNRAGYLKLCDWLSQAYLTNQFQGRPEIKKDWFLETGTDGVIALSGAEGGEVGVAMAKRNMVASEEIAKGWKDLFGNRFYLEVQRGDGGRSEQIVQATVKLGSKLNIPVLATHPVQFLRRDDFNAHEARVCISEGHLLGDSRRPKIFDNTQYLMSQSEMVSLYQDFPELLENTVQVAKRCSFSFELGVPKLPIFPTPDGEDLSKYLGKTAEVGLKRRLARLYPSDERMPRTIDTYSKRLKYELEIIGQMDYPGYFLVVADFINWAKKNGIPVGPGRGSGAGSLVAFSLEITDLDPLKYNLLFERFLNPERVSMPDFDIDFCQNGRDRVIDYVRGKYGDGSVSQIATFGTMAAKAVVRDVARVMDWNYGRADELAKLIPFQPGKLVTLKQARVDEPRLLEREKSDEETRELLRLAEQLEGLPRNVGMHAGGVLIAPNKLTDYCPLYLAPGSDSIISQLDKYDVEAIGLVKFDFLGLTTLTILDWTLKFIRALDPSIKLDLENIPMDDGAAYSIFSKGSTVAVFQFESSGMRELLVQAKPDRFEDIIALVALYRPGPMSLIPDYIARKHGQRFNYPDSRVESILEETYGIMVYQEQVMQMAQIIGGYSLGGADLLRRAMGNKKAEEMAQQRDNFRIGASKNGLSQRKADDIFDLMEKFAGYGFNKSHAAAYALVAYQTAYLKAHFLAPFMAANLSLSMDDTDRVEQLITDLKENGIELEAPDINRADYHFFPIDKKSIRFGLGAVKGTGEAAVKNIVESRKKEPFRDLFDFCERIDRSTVNRGSIESLVRAGAFDALHDNRSQVFSSVGLAIKAAEQTEKSEGQANLFSSSSGELSGRQLVGASFWEPEKKLRQEKEALGFYFSGHLFDVYKDEVRKFVKRNLGEVNRYGDTELVAGVIRSVKRRNTQRGRMALVVLDDGIARLELPVFSELFEKHYATLEEDSLVIFRVRRDRRPGDRFGQGVRLIADEIYSLSQARTHFAVRLNLHLNGDSSSKKLKEVIQPYAKGSVPIRVIYNNGSAKAEFQLGEDWRLNLEDDLLRSLTDSFPTENINIEYK